MSVICRVDDYEKTKYDNTTF